MRHSATTGKIDAAVAAVQSSIRPVTPNKGVDVDGPKAKWSSGYATLAAVHASVRDALVANGVAVYQGGVHVVGSGERVVTRLAKDGEWIESDYPVKPSRDGAQGFGGGRTFAKRWGLCDMVGIQVEDDNDEQTGYRAERASARAATRQKAPAGLGSSLEAIRSAQTGDTFIDSVRKARAAHPTGDGAAQVEKTIEAWFLESFSGANDVASVAALKEIVKNVQPRGTAVRDAAAAAERRTRAA